jgi:hypothetical protein
LFVGGADRDADAAAGAGGDRGPAAAVGKTLRNGIGITIGDVVERNRVARGI